jgi:hypothetical protein
MDEPNLQKLAEGYRLTAAGYAARARSSEGVDRAFFAGIEKSYVELAALMKQTAMDSAARLARAAVIAADQRKAHPEG